MIRYLESDCLNIILNLFCNAKNLSRFFTFIMDIIGIKFSFCDFKVFILYYCCAKFYFQRGKFKRFIIFDHT